MGQPRDAHPVTQAEPAGSLSQLVDDAHDLMARNDQLVLGWEVAFGQVEIGAADPADAHVHPDLAHSRCGNCSVDTS